MKHLVEDFGVTAWVVTIVLIGSFTILFRVADKISPEAIVGLVGGWVGGCLTTFGILKSAKRQKEP